MKKTLIALLLVLILLGGCAKTAATDNTWAALKEKGYIVMGLDDTFAPMGFRDNAGNIVGFDVDLANEVAKRLDIEIRFQPIDWTLKESELNAGNIDLIWNGYTMTPGRKEQVNFTDPYMENSQLIVTMAGSDIQSKKDLAGKTIALQKDSSAYDAVMAEKDVVENLKQEPIQFDTNNEAFMDLEAGRVDAIVVDEVLARYYMKLRGEENYAVLEDDFGDEEYGVGVRKSDTELLEKLNAVLNEMKADGTFDEIRLKWFSDN